MNSIDIIRASNVIKKGTSAEQNVEKVDFKDFLFDSLQQVSNDQNNADALDQALMTGEIDNIHEVMIASQKAELSLSFAVEVRNKILDAYKEIMRMQM